METMYTLMRSKDGLTTRVLIDSFESVVSTHVDHMIYNEDPKLRDTVMLIVEMHKLKLNREDRIACLHKLIDRSAAWQIFEIKPMQGRSYDA